MKLANGHYHTQASSTVEVSGEHSGCVFVAFDWVEEPDACIDCRVNPYPVDWGDGEHRLTWDCEFCQGGSAPLKVDPDGDVAESSPPASSRPLA